MEEGTRREFLELATLLGTGIVLAGGATGVVIGAGAGEAGATPPSGKLARTELAVGRLDKEVTISTSGPTDFHIQHVVLEPGADSGWHTHPGIALDIVAAGTLTAYLDGTDCEPVEVEAGHAFLFPAGVAHKASNETDERVEVYVTYLVVAGSAPREDAEAPESCTRPA